MIFILTIIVVCCFLIYYLSQQRHSYWRNRGFVQLEPKFLFGNIATSKERKSFGELFQQFYEKSKIHSLVGVYLFYKPVLMVNDPIVLQNIFIKNFTSFHDRPVNINLEVDPLQDNLFNTPGKKWRELRTKLSPTFTSGKLKAMFSIIKDCGNVLDTYLVNNVENGNNVFEFRDLFARLMTNIISSVAFGIENDCINEPDHIFRKMGKRIFEMTSKQKFRAMCGVVFPALKNIIKFKFTHDDVEVFFHDVVKQTISYREENNVERNDFMQLLIQLKNQGYVSADKGEGKETKEGNGNQDFKKISYEDLAANALLFFIAGFETSSSTLSFCIFELAKNQHIQRKVQEELDNVLAAHDNEGFTYETIHELKYLESCIDEALRKYPIVPLLFRVCNEDFRVPDSNLVVPKGTEVMIPVLGIHRNPDIYENPMEFRPERFFDSSTGATTTKGCYYLPFGDGPRNCIGMRLAKLTTKIGMAAVLTKFNVELDDMSLADKELEIDPDQFVHTPSKPFNLKVTPRKPF